MSSPKIIVKSGYIKSVVHAMNILEYSGNKIAAQAVVFSDGSKMTVDHEDIIHLNKAEQEQVSGIEISFKDGGSHVITYPQYRAFVDESAQTIRVGELTAVLDEGTFVNADGKQYHAMKDLDFFKYLSYIEARPGAEKVHGHGLFGLCGDVSIEEAKEQALAHEKSIKWSHIISLPEEDGARLGYDTRDTWANLIKAKAPQIAKAYNISLGNLVINAAYHSNTDNDHCHLLFYSRDEREGYVKGGKEGMRKASERLKSLFVNEIYRNDLAVVKTTKNEQELELKTQLKELLSRMERPSYAPPDVVAGKLIELGEAMRPLKGKREYGYLPAGIKQQVDDILKSVVQDDNTIHELYIRYMDTNRALVSSYYTDPVKIDARMKTMEQSFFSPDKKHDRQLHNIIVRAATALDEQMPGAGRASSEGETQDYRAAGGDASVFIQSDDGDTSTEGASAFFELDQPEGFAASDERENRRYHVGGGRARDSGNNPTPMQKLNHGLYRHMKSMLMQEEPCALDSIAEQLHRIEPTPKYIHMPPEIKQSINNVIAEFISLESNREDYAAELERRAKKLSSNEHFKSLPVLRQLEEVKNRFINPDAYTSKQLHETVLRICQQADHYRFVFKNSSAFFFSMKKEAFAATQNNPYDTLFKQLNAEGEKDCKSFASLNQELQEKINEVAQHLLAKNNLPNGRIEEFTALSNLPLPDFHNTLFLFVKTLDKQREVHERSAEFFKTLRAGCEEENTLKSYQVVHEVLKPLAAKQYQELPEQHKEKICEVVGRVLAATGADSDTVEYFSHPAEDTPLGLHNIVQFYLKRLDLQLFADEISKDFYTGLQTLAFPESNEETILDELLEKLKDINGAYYQELPKELKQDIAAVVGKLVGDCGADKDLVDAFTHPDEFTPLGMHDQVFRMAKRLDQNRFTREISGTFYSSMREKAFADADVGKHMMKLCEQLEGKQELSYGKLTSQQKVTVNELVGRILKGIDANQDIINQFTHPDELTPTRLQNTVVRFAAQLKQQRFIHDFSSSFFSSLREGAFVDGELKTVLQELNRQLARLKEADTPFSELPDNTKELITDVVKQILEQHRIPPEVIRWFIPPSDDSPLNFHNMVRGCATHYYEHQFIQTNRHPFYRTLADTCANNTSEMYARLAYIRDRLSAYPPDARYDVLSAADQAEIIRVAYAVLRNQTDPTRRDAHNILARKLLLEKDAPKDLQNMVMRVARNLDEISAKAKEAKRQRAASARYHALRLCLLIGKTLAQMAEDNHTAQQGQRNESKLERSFKHRKKEKHQNIAEY